MTDSSDNSNKDSSKISGVAASIIDQYLTELAKNKDYSETAMRLRDVLKKKGASNDAAIRTALFGEDSA